MPLRPADAARGVTRFRTRKPPTGRVPMRPINVYEFIEFGVTVQTLRWFLRVDSVDRRTFAVIKQGQLEEFRDRWLIPQNVGLDLINHAISRLDGAVQEDTLN